MKIRFVSDTHLGLSRQSHTTPESAKRLQQALFDSAMEAVKGQTNAFVVHAADFLLAGRLVWFHGRKKNRYLESSNS